MKLELDDRKTVKKEINAKIQTLNEKWKQISGGRWTSIEKKNKEKIQRDPCLLRKRENTFNIPLMSVLKMDL